MHRVIVASYRVEYIESVVHFVSMVGYCKTSKTKHRGVLKNENLSRTITKKSAEYILKKRERERGGTMKNAKFIINN